MLHTVLKSYIRDTQQEIRWGHFRLSKFNFLEPSGHLGPVIGLIYLSVAAILPALTVRLKRITHSLCFSLNT